MLYFFIRLYSEALPMFLDVMRFITRMEWMHTRMVSTSAAGCAAWMPATPRIRGRIRMKGM